MVLRDPLATSTPEKKETQSPVSTRNGLDELKAKLPEKPGLFQMIQDLLKDFKHLDSTERKKRMATILGAAALGWFLGKEKKQEEGAIDDESAGSEDETSDEMADEAGSEEMEENEKESQSDSREKRRKVVCNDARLIVINTDPAGNLRPKILEGKSSYSLEYGLPDFETFTEEMMDILAPKIKNKKEAMKKVVAILKRSPMGKYQCMPQYLFKYVDKFKNLKWKEEGQEKEKLHAMWEFLQSEEMQRNACRGYVRSTVAALKSEPGFNNDPRYVYAAYYGGLSAGQALLARDMGTATEKQKKRVGKKQGAYISIEGYAGKRKDLKQFPPIDIETVVSGIAGRESGSYEGKKSRPRDEKWERDQRFAYNRSAKKDDNLAVA